MRQKGIDKKEREREKHDDKRYENILERERERAREGGPAYWIMLPSTR